MVGYPISVLRHLSTLSMVEVIALIASLVTIGGGGWRVVKWLRRRRVEHCQKRVEMIERSDTQQSGGIYGGNTLIL